MAATDSKDGAYPYNLGIDESFSTNVMTLMMFSSHARIHLTRGLVWMYAFNHEASIQCFKQALDADPECAMAHWGLSCSNGPNYNTPKMSRDDFPSAVAAYEHAQKAIDLIRDGKIAAKHSPLERALVEALSVRFNPPPESVTSDIDQNTAEYAEALAKVYAAFPDSACAAAFYAESLLNFSPWRLWNLDTGAPTEYATKAKEVLECAIAVLNNNDGGRETAGVAKHPGLLHFYIHLMEMSPNPDAALQCSNTLRCLCPDAGHLVHMPSHIYILLGLWKDAAEANKEAFAVDAKWIAKEGIFNCYTGYRIHNIHFIAYAAMFAGHFGVAIKAATDLRDALPVDLLKLPVFNMFFESYRSVDKHVLIRFGKWKEILEQPPEEDAELFPYSVCMYHYSRGIAHAVTGATAAAETDLALLRECAAKVPPLHVLHNNTCSSLIAVAEQMLIGETKYRQGAYVECFDALERASALSDALVYDEPWGWMQPPRHTLGALLLEQGDYSRAETHFRADMDRGMFGRCHPDNIWALRGLLSSLQAKQAALSASPAGPVSEGAVLLALAQEIREIEEKLVDVQHESDQKIEVACLCATSSLQASSHCC